MRNVWSLKRELDELKLYAADCDRRLTRLESVSFEKYEPIPPGVVFIADSKYYSNLFYMNGYIVNIGSMQWPDGKGMFPLYRAKNPVDFTGTWEEDKWYIQDGEPYPNAYALDFFGYNNMIITAAGDMTGLYYITNILNHTSGVYKLTDNRQSDDDDTLYATPYKNGLLITYKNEYAVVTDFPKTPWDKVKKKTTSEPLYRASADGDRLYYLRPEADKWAMRRRLAYIDLTTGEEVLGEDYSDIFDGASSMMNEGHLQVWCIDGEYYLRTDKYYAEMYRIDGTSVGRSSYLSVKVNGESLYSISKYGDGYLVTTQKTKQLWAATDLLDETTHRQCLALDGKSGDILYHSLQLNPYMETVIAGRAVIFASDNKAVLKQLGGAYSLFEPMPPNPTTILYYSIGWLVNAQEDKTYNETRTLETIFTGPFMEEIPSIQFTLTISNSEYPKYTVSNIERNGQTYPNLESAGIRISTQFGRQVGWKTDVVLKFTGTSCNLSGTMGGGHEIHLTVMITVDNIPK